MFSHHYHYLKPYPFLFTSSCHGPEAALAVFRLSLRHVAKSGEVWCEGARIFLNPSSPLFHLRNAVKCLNLAVFFTPQYGDTIIEVGFIRARSSCIACYLLDHSSINDHFRHLSLFS